MARGNTVELVFAGDSKSLEKTFEKVGSGAKDMAKDLDKAEGQAKTFGTAMDGAAGATDAAEGKFMGTADLLDGLGGAFGLPTEGATNMMRSFGDLSGGFTALGPMIGSLGSSLGALATGPVGLIVLGVGALVTALVVAYKNSETFRDIVQGAFQAIKAVVGPIIETIGGWLSGLGKLFGGAGDDSEEMTDTMKTAAENSQRAWEAWKGTVVQQLDDILNPLRTAREQSKTSLEDIKKNLDDNVNFYTGWINNLTTLTNRGFGELATYFHSLGPEAEKAVGQAITLTDPQLKALSNNIKNNLAEAGSQGANLLVDGIGGKDYGQLGATVGEKFLNGLTNVFKPGTPEHYIVNNKTLLGPALGRASGGPVSAGSPYIVGEQGPELFVPGMSGAIIPNRAAAGGGTEVIQLVLDGRVVAEVVRDQLLRTQQRTPLGFAS